jgi:uncharacterized protein
MHLFRQFVLKVHSRCNLACDHCYVYEAADQSWRDKPRAMSAQTLKVASESLARYAERHELAAVQIVLHGGEPLLLGRERMRQVIDELKAVLLPVTQLELVVQTNGVRLDQSFADLFLAEGVRVGVSLDGGRLANDRHRRYRNGQSSYLPVVRAVRLLGSPEYRPIFAGLLCTVDVNNDPVQVFDDLAALEPPSIDLLLPHATWEHPPPQARPGAALYGDWLCAVFDRWFDAPPVVGIRLFEELINVLLGGPSHSEAIGLSTPTSLVIETDGSLEETDALKVAYPGAPATGLSVFDHKLEDVVGRLRSATALADLSPTCQACPVVEACGGGLYPHRYDPASGFANPSVYCADLQRLIYHVAGRLRATPAVDHLIAGSPALRAR